ncbi:MAG: hypothetical protein Kow0090_21930 [Myxococcota bacterium]
MKVEALSQRGVSILLLLKGNVNPSSVFWAFIFSLTFVSLLLPGVLCAAENVFVVPFRGESEVPTPVIKKIDEMFQARLSAQLGVKVSNSISLKDKREEEASAAISEANKALSQGRAFYLDVKFPEAETALKRSIETFVNYLPYLNDLALMGEAVMFLAMTLEASGRLKSADSYFSLLARLLPDYKPDEALFSPGVIVRFKKAASEEAKRPRATISVASAPALANVFLNGKKLGTTPLSPVEVPPGICGLRVEKKGFVTHYEKIELDGGKSRELTVVLSEPPGASQLVALAKSIEEESETKRQTEIAASLGVALETEKVVIGRIKKHEDSLLLIVALIDADEAKPPKVRAGFIDADLLTAPKAINQIVKSLSKKEGFIFFPGGVLPTDVKLDFSASLLGKAVTEAAVKVTDEPIVVAEERVPIYKKWWFWTVVGVVTAGAATGAIIYATRSGKETNGEKPEPIREDDSIKVILEF